MPGKPGKPDHPARIMRLLQTMNEKLDVAISGHGGRIQKLEAGHVDHETRLSTLERTVKWVVGKIEGGGGRERR